MTCLDCGRDKGPWRRGLCNACYERHRRAGTLNHAPAHSLPLDYVAEEWAFLSSWGLGRAEVAARLGMTKKAFEKALARHARKQHRPEEAA